MADLEVGQTVFYVNTQRHRPLDPVALPVAKVAKKWVTVGESWRPLRFRLEDLKQGSAPVDGGQYTSPGRIWLSLEAYAEEGERRAAWKRVTQLSGLGPPPDHLSLADIKQIVSMLEGQPHA